MSLKLWGFVGGALVFVLLAIGIRAGINKISAQGKEIAQLQTSLATEKEQRVRDDAALTSLTQGIIAASSARALDEQTLRESIDATKPNPSSPGLSKFINGLRSSDQRVGQAGAAQRPNATAKSGTGSPSKH